MAGNPNPTGGKPDKLIRDALKAAIRQEPEKLKRIAKKMLDLAEEGNVPAFKEITDRIDGKAVQPIVGDDEHPPVQASLSVTFIPPKVTP